MKTTNLAVLPREGLVNDHLCPTNAKLFRAYTLPCYLYTYVLITGEPYYPVTALSRFGAQSPVTSAWREWRQEM